MESTMLEKGKGLIKKITVDGISGTEVFQKDKHKKGYIECLISCETDGLALLAYCILNNSAHILVKGESETKISSYVARVNESFSSIINQKQMTIGYPFRNEIVSQRIKSEEIKDAIIYIHRLPLDCEPSEYAYSSYDYLKDGNCFAVKVIRAEYDNLSKKEFLSWFDGKASGKYRNGNSGKESYKEVIEASKARYFAPYPNVPEEVLTFMLSEICDRTKVSYKTAARRMSISYKKRRDVMIRTLCDLMERRGRTFYEAVDAMRLKKENIFNLMLEAVAELNRLHGYSYDHITSVLGLNDIYYDYLVEIICGLHAQTGFTFEQIVVKFHLKNDIISIRQRCGF